MKILEGNKLIAEFMGAKWIDTTQGWLHWFLIRLNHRFRHYQCPNPNNLEWYHYQCLVV